MVYVWVIYLQRFSVVRLPSSNLFKQVVAKLAAGLHKPNQLTVVPHSSVHKLFETVAVHKMRGLGGKLGEQVSEHLQVQTMAQLAEVSAAKLTSIFGTRTG